MLRKLAAGSGLAGELVIDSAGIGAWHAGEPPQPLAIEVAAARGYELDHRARRVEPGDLCDFDLLVALDRSHRRALLDMSLDLELRSKVRLMLGDGRDVPDPYGRDRRAYEHTLDLIEEGCRELLAELIAPPPPL